MSRQARVSFNSSSVKIQVCSNSRHDSNMVCALLRGSEGVTLTDGGAAVDSGRQRTKEGRMVGQGVRSDQKYLENAVSSCSCTCIYAYTLALKTP